MVTDSNVTTQQQREAVRAWLGTGSLNIFGIQFSGKDTQLKRLQLWTGGVIMGGGKISRQVMDELPEDVRVATLAGELIPLKYFLKLVTPYFAKPEFAGEPLLLSAVGRWHGEEQGISEAAAAAGHTLKAVIWIELSEEEVWRRWRLMNELADREERIDDATEGLRMRLQWFKDKTLPVKEFYRERGLMFSVDGSKTPDEVEANILAGLYSKSQVRS